MSKNIIWLASYPKSGNTWMRIFLINLMRGADKPAPINELNEIKIASHRKLFNDYSGMESSDLTPEEIERIRPDVYAVMARETKEDPLFLKIHDAYTYTTDQVPLVSRNATKGAIYIIRNPLDVAVSYAMHRNVPMDEIIREMNDESKILCNLQYGITNQLPQRLLSWSKHVNSWVTNHDIPVHIVRYEDMQQQPLDTFTQVVRFAGLKYTEEEIKQALAFSDIKELQRQETADGFREKNKEARAFFRKGVINDWKVQLHAEQIQQLTKDHGALMEKFGYLTDDLFVKV